MKKTVTFPVIFAVILILLTGCGQAEDVRTPMSPASESAPEATTAANSEAAPTSVPLAAAPAAENTAASEPVSDINEVPVTETILTTELESYFQGINGCAVFYLPAESKYYLYNPELSRQPSSPCSTFKIVSSLIGLETGLIDPADSVYTWNGTTYWNKDWNRDIDFETAFRVSCIWYFREVIDRAGEDTVLDYLNRLEYGNCDISDWQGHQNTNNNIDELRGFWVESSLKISPLNQAEVMKTIFESNTYSRDNISLLKQVMLTDNGNDNITIYGKTGMGVANGLCIDAWFTGMAETDDTTIYFAVRLDDPNNEETSSTKAKEIAIKILNNYDFK